MFKFIVTFVSLLCGFSDCVKLVHTEEFDSNVTNSKGVSFSWCEGILVLTAALCNSLYNNKEVFLRFTLIAMGRVYLSSKPAYYNVVVSHLIIKICGGSNVYSFIFGVYTT